MKCSLYMAMYCCNVLSFVLRCNGKVWPHCEYPLIPVGRFILNRNPKNYFAEVEQSAFCPAHMVPGIEPSPDKLLQVTLLSTNTFHTSLAIMALLHVLMHC